MSVHSVVYTKISDASLVMCLFVIVQSLLRDCVKPAADVATSLVNNTPVGGSSSVHKMFRVVEAGLGYQYVSVWNLVLMVINQFFQVGSVASMQFLVRLSNADKIVIWFYCFASFPGVDKTAEVSCRNH